MKSNIILVIGSVTKKHYEPLRLEMLRAGIKPRVVRISHELFCTDIHMFLGSIDGKPTTLEPALQRLVDAFGSHTWENPATMKHRDRVEFEGRMNVVAERGLCVLLGEDLSEIAYMVIGGTETELSKSLNTIDDYRDAGDDLPSDIFIIRDNQLVMS